LGSEVLLQKHVDLRQHTSQAKFQTGVSLFHLVVVGNRADGPAEGFTAVAMSLARLRGVLLFFRTRTGSTSHCSPHIADLGVSLRGLRLDFSQCFASRPTCHQIACRGRSPTVCRSFGTTLATGP
jgi:hypothetical protein